MVNHKAARYRESILLLVAFAKKLPLQTKPVIELLLLETLKE